jgi:D-alanyl-D-alanine carboxypeptidase, serine-type, PBP4 family
MRILTSLRSSRRTALLASALIAVAVPASAAPPAPSLPAEAADGKLLAAVQELLSQGPAGTRYGILVTTPEGKPVLSIAPDQRFIPASNTKIFTTVAAYAQLAALDGAARGTGVRLESAGKGAPDVILKGYGDARLSAANDCSENCLATLADAVAARTRRVRDVVGDDTWYPDERWSPGMSWNNIQFRYGTGISALSLDDNELTAVVAPAAEGSPANVTMPGFYAVQNDVRTVPGDAVNVETMRMPNSEHLRLTGTIGADASPQELRFGIDDPARYAAWKLREMLRARGVKVNGEAKARHRPLAPADDPAKRKGVPAAQAPEPEMLAQLPALPLAADVKIINKVSQNLHAELMLRRVGHLWGSGSIADGQAALADAMAAAGVPEGSYLLADGSGMSSYNRVTPRAVVTLLRWVAKQPWSAAWRDSLPVGGQDGTLRARFQNTPLNQKVFAKTGSLNASRALSGYLVAASGRTLVFSAIANDMPEGGDNAATAVMDRVLQAVAAAN